MQSSSTPLPTPSPAAQKTPLRIGIMVDSLFVNNWMYAIIDEIQQSTYANIELVVLNDSQPGARPKLSLWQRIVTLYREGIYNRYVDWDYNRYVQGADEDAMAPRNAETLLAAAEQLKVRPIETKFVDRFEADDVNAIKAANLDVMIRFGFRIIKGDILEVAKYGVWSYHHGDNKEYRGGAPLFWELYEKNPKSGVILQILTSDLDGGKVIYRSISRTDLNSLYRNQNPIYWKATTFAPRRLRDLYHFGWDFIESLETYNEKVTYNRRIYRAPDGLQMMRFLGRRFLDGARSQFHKLFFDDLDHQWFCAIRRRDQENWHQINADRDRFYADPFLVEEDGKTFMFIEEYPYATAKGLISYCEIRDDCSQTPLKVIMDEDVHLSYPAIFKHDGEYYMTPETYDANQVRLYKAKQFPEQWELESILLDNVKAADATIHIQDGKFYMFCNICETPSSVDVELHLFHADNIKGPWLPHPLNPVVSDVQSSRPAGNLYLRDGELIRPAQDCSRRYGYAMSLNRVDKLSTTEYQEEVVEKILPDWLPGILATHTQNFSSKFEVRDGQHPFRRRRNES